MKKFIQFDFVPEFLAGDAPTIGKYQFPQINPNNYLPEEPTLPFNYLTSTKERQNYWFHCFIYDKQFQKLWRNFWYYLPMIRQAKGLISTDFSLFRDYNEELLVYNCRRNRSIDYALQKAGITMIPTAGFADESSWEWCFDGLPEHSTLAITTNGTLSDPEAKRLFIGGVRALINQKEPTVLVVCGKYPKWLDTKYAGVKIIHIQSYSEMRRNRRCA